MKLWHGTTARRYAQIQKDGYLRGGVHNPNWNVSGDYVYFWSEEFLRKEYSLDLDGDTDENTENLYAHAYDQAGNSAIFALADEPPGDNYSLVVLEYHTETLEKHGIEWEPDKSCLHMEGAVQVLQPLSLKLCTGIHRLKENLTPFAPYILGTRIARRDDMHGLAAPFRREPSDIEEKVAKIVMSRSRDECKLYEALSDVLADTRNWETINLMKGKNRSRKR